MPSEPKNFSCEIALSPQGSLRFLSSGNPSPQILSLDKKFSEDWRKGWFYLASDRIQYDAYPSLSFWQGIAKEYITELCHLPEEMELPCEIAPKQNFFKARLYQMPPMKGGEYLSLSCLQEMWQQIHIWTKKNTKEYANIHVFLQEQAPKWQQVGKVCFHLAENKKDQNRPFAFLATYSIGFSQQGNIQHQPLKKALEESIRANSNQSLIKLLSPVQKAADLCPWVKSLLHTNEVYQPLAWSPNQAYLFLKTIPKLEESGLSVRIPNWWKHRPRPKVSVTIGSKKQSVLGVDQMLDFKVEATLGGQSLSEEELELLRASKEGIVYIRGQWVEVNGEKLQQALEHWEQVQQHAKKGEISFIEGMRLLAGAPSFFEQKEKLKSWVNVSAGNALEDLLKQFRDPSSIAIENSLHGLQATLRHYQTEGVKWLSLLSELHIGACLADDMGLGKTIQVLSLLLARKNQKRQSSHLPCLLIAPASLLGNWKNEAISFTPSLKIIFIHPSEKEDFQRIQSKKPTEFSLKDIDLVITTYTMLSKQKWFLKSKWDIVILDEAQAIKNAQTKQSISVKSLQSCSRIALTGTPIENRLSDLWSLFDFLNPGLLGSFSRFKSYVKTLETSDFSSLRKLVSPYILRRMKTDPKIISDLPDKIETNTYCYLTKKQAEFYQSIVNDLQNSLETVDPNNRRAVVLQALTNLKQICNHPCHFSREGEYAPEESGKFMRLKEICEELASRQEKVLIFTQFSEIISPLVDYVSTIFDRKGVILHGKTPIKERKYLVESFQKDDGPPFFILSLKAGGTGLTLTAASHVIHFDRWWNPAVENQATDRAFRIGQKKNVQVHKFLTQGTIEEEIDKIISSKQKLATEILQPSDEVKLTELSDDALLNLVTLDIDRASIS